MADDDDRLALQARQPADDRHVIGIHAIAVQLVKVAEDRADVVERVGTLRVTGELGDLPRGQVGEDRFGECAALGPQPRNLLLDVDLGVGGDVAELLDLGLKFGDRLLKIEKTDGHLAGDSKCYVATGKRTGSDRAVQGAVLRRSAAGCKSLAAPQRASAAELSATP